MSRMWNAYVTSCGKYQTVTSCCSAQSRGRRRKAWPRRPARDSLLRARGFGDRAQRRLVARREEQGRGAALAPRRKAVADPFNRPDQRHFVDERVRHLAGRLALLPAEEELLDLARLRLVAVAAEEIVVEVLSARAHAADV